jgi:hypothetical protein
MTATAQALTNFVLSENMGSGSEDEIVYVQQLCKKKRKLASSSESSAEVQVIEQVKVRAVQYLVNVGDKMLVGLYRLIGCVPKPGHTLGPSMKILNEMTWRVKREENCGEERATILATGTTHHIELARMTMMYPTSSLGFSLVIR